MDRRYRKLTCHCLAHKRYTPLLDLRITGTSTIVEALALLPLQRAQCTRPAIMGHLANRMPRLAQLICHSRGKDRILSRDCTISSIVATTPTKGDGSHPIQQEC